MNFDANRPIGVFDSGLGGLTIVRALKTALPNEDILYFGDTAHLPYGDKSPELLKHYIVDILQFLIKKNVKTIVVACNTASSVLGDWVEQIVGEIPIFDVILPTVGHVLKQAENIQKIGVIGTKTTIASNIYKKQINRLNSKITVIQKRTALLAPMIEENWINNEISKSIIKEYLNTQELSDIDGMLLACTHYPMIKNEIEVYYQEIFDRKIEIFDSSIVMAEHVKNYLNKNELLRQGETEAKLDCYVSDFTENFRQAAEIFLGNKIDMNLVTP